MQPELRATPQQPALGAIARGLRSLQELAGQYQILPQVPLLGGMGIDELLGLPGAAREVENWSYGNAPLRINPYAGRTASFVPEVKPGRKSDLADTILLGADATAVPALAGTLGRGAVSGARALEDATVGALQRARVRAAAERAPQDVAYDPLRTRLEEQGSLMYAVKPKGGNWLSGKVEEALSQFKGADEETAVRAMMRYNPDLSLEQARTLVDAEMTAEPQQRAINRWIDTKLAKYVRNELGTLDDPVKALAERGVLHFQPHGIRDVSPMMSAVRERRIMGGFPAEGYATTPLGQQWERYADIAVEPTPAQVRVAELKNRGTPFSKNTLEENPWLETLPTDTPVYSPDSYAFVQSDEQLGLPHLIDELKAAMDPNSELPQQLRFDPKDIDKLTVPQAVERVARINAWRAEEAARAELAGMMANLEGSARIQDPSLQLSFVEKPGGTWIDLPEASEGKNIDFCTTIGKQGGWCTQHEGAARQYGSGDNRLAVLVDAEGRPHLQAMITKSVEKPHSDELRKFFAAAEEEAKQLPRGYTDEDIRDIALRMYTDSKPSNITELKPPGNSFDSDRAKKYAERDPAYKQKLDNAVLDFLNSQQWGTVKDIERYGIIDLQNPDSVLNQLRSMYGSKSRQPGIDAFNTAADENPYAPRFMKRGEFVQFLEPYGPVDGMAKGGPVKMALGGLVQKYATGGEVDLQSMFTGTPPSDTEPGVIGRGVRSAVQQLGTNLYEAATDPVAFNKRALGNIARRLQEDPEGFAMDWTGGGLGGVIKPKGGNWLAGQVERAVAPMKSRYFGEEIDAAQLVPVPNRPPEYPAMMYASSGEIFNLEQASRMMSEGAINTWLDSKLTKYIKNEMATPEDPLRLAADKWAVEQQKQLAAKQLQIDKAQADFDKALRERGQPPEELTRSRARILELEKERDFIASRTGLHFTPRETGPIYRSQLEAERSLYGYPTKATATSPVARSWEDLADTYLGRRSRAGKIIHPDYYLRPEDASRVYAENPWLFKVPPETDVNFVNRGVSERETGFKHMMDELRNALNPESGLPKELQITTKDLEKKSVADIADLVDRINAHRAVQKAEADKLAAQKSIEVYKEYPESEKGLRWVEMKQLDYNQLPKEQRLEMIERLRKEAAEKGLSPEDYIEQYPRKELETALKYEGDVMQHCVGGYCPDVVSGQSRIFSLRDASGRPHATVEVHPQTLDSVQNLEHYVGRERALEIYDEFNAVSSKALYEDKFAEPFQAFVLKKPDVAAAVESMGLIPPKINQIKGFNNRKPAEEVIPYVQDFVKSQRWSGVDDLQNTGLVKIDPKSDLARDLRAAQIDVPDYVTNDQLTELFNAVRGKAAGGAIGMAAGGVVRGYATGGAVSFDADEIAELAQSVLTQNYAAGGLVRYDPKEIDTLASQLIEEFHG